ncbi:hypothetical protein [Novilysobacter erysipheiresistens]|uniref:Uncharacterized protein n=1 Tax=Novilysobacter erysipheiresistens TaxID=1749332 RepID=A0ABU7YZ60_9GAMM
MPQVGRPIARERHGPASSNELRFSNRNAADIVVTGARIESGGRTLRDDSIAGYHADLRGFLDTAGSMAKVAKSLLGNHGAFPQAATDMCSAILAVQWSGHAMEQRFPGRLADPSYAEIASRRSRSAAVV